MKKIYETPNMNIVRVEQQLLDGTSLGKSESTISIGHTTKRICGRVGENDGKASVYRGFGRLRGEGRKKRNVYIALILLYMEGGF